MPDGALYRKFSLFSDGISNTIVAIDLPNHSVPWRQPKDLTISEAIQLIRANKQSEMIQPLMLDGSVINLGKLTDETLINLFTINDGIVVNIP